MREVGLLHIGLDIEPVHLEQRERRLTRRHVLARPEIDFGGDAVLGRHDARVGKIERRLVALRRGLAHARMVVGVDVETAAEIGEGLREVLLHRGGLCAGAVVVVARLVVLRNRDIAVADQPLLAIELALVELQRILGLLELSLLLPICRLHHVDVVARADQLRLGARERDLVGLVVDPEQQGALGDRLVIADVDLDDAARDVAADLHLVGPHIGVLGRDVPAARHVVVGGARQHHERTQAEQHHANAAALEQTLAMVAAGPSHGGASGAARVRRRTEQPRVRPHARTDCPGL